MNDYEDFDPGEWEDQYGDDIEFGGQKLVKQVQSNTPERLAGDRNIPGLNDGDYLLPNSGLWLVAKGGYAHITIGATPLWVHWAANRSGFLGISDVVPPKQPPGSRWLKPGVTLNIDLPVVTKEGQYDLNDLSVWERTLYLHQIAYGVYDQSGAFLRIDPPILCSFPYKSTALKTGEGFYHSKLKTTTAVKDGKRVHNMVLGAWRQGSVSVTGRNKQTWQAPTQTPLGVYGEPGYPAELAAHAKRLRDEFKQSLTPLWAPAPLPALAPPKASSTPSTPPSSSGASSGARGPTPRPDIRSGRGAWSEPYEPPIPPPPPSSSDGGHDGGYIGPRDEDDIIFD